jgi:hypothetical protein
VASADLDEDIMAEALNGIAYTHSATADEPECPDAEGWLYKAEAAAMEAMGIFKRGGHPKLAHALSSLADVYCSRYSIHPDFELGRAVGPQHGEDGNRAIELFKQALAAFEKAGTQDTDQCYAATLCKWLRNHHY